MPAMHGRQAMGIAGCVLAVGGALQLGDLAPTVLGSLLLVGNLLLLRWWGRRRRSGSFHPAAVVGPVGASWLAVAILPVHSFSQRSSGQAVTSVGVQPVLELLVFLVVGLVALGVIRTFEPTLARARPPVVLVLLPMWVTVSCLWSPVPPYACIRGVQMTTVVLLAWATMAMGRHDRSLVDGVFELVLRWIPRITLVLVALGVAFGPIYATVGAANAGRFTWIGAHPNGSGLALAVAIVVTAITPPRVLRLPPWAVVATLAVLVVAMYENHSRTSWFCIVAGLLVAFVLKGRLDPLLRWVGTPLLGAGAVAVAALWWGEIWDYLLRDGSESTLRSGNGRRELWSIGFRSMSDAFDWFAGHGYGVARTLFVEEQPWAGDAHNSVLALLVSTGLVSLVLLGAATVAVLARLVRATPRRGVEHTVAAASLLTLVFVNAMTTDVLAEPTIGFALLNLVAAYLFTGPREPVVPEDAAVLAWSSAP